MVRNAEAGSERTPLLQNAPGPSSAPAESSATSLDDPQKLPKATRNLILAAVWTGVFLGSLDTTIVARSVSLCSLKAQAHRSPVNQPGHVYFLRLSGVQSSRSAGDRLFIDYCSLYAVVREARRHYRSEICLAAVFLAVHRWNVGVRNCTVYAMVDRSTSAGWYGWGCEFGYPKSEVCRRRR